MNTNAENLRIFNKIYDPSIQGTGKQYPIQVCQEFGFSPTGLAYEKNVGLLEYSDYNHARRVIKVVANVSKVEVEAAAKLLST